MAAKILPVTTGGSNNLDTLGSHYLNFFDVVCDNSYPLGGYPILPKQVTLNTIIGATVIGGTPTGIAYRPAWDDVNNNLMIGSATQPNEVAAGLNLTGLTVRLGFFGF